jgi:hypothetical protein
MMQKYRNLEEFLETNFWWNVVVHPFAFEFLKLKIVKFYSQGWVIVANVWVAIEGRFASIEELKDRTTSPPLNMNNWDTLGLLLKWRNVGGRCCVPKKDFALLQNGWWCLKEVTNYLILYFKHPLNF